MEKNLEKICKYAIERTEKFQGIKTCYNCKLKEKILCFEPETYKDCYYFYKKKKPTETVYIAGRCTDISYLFDSIYLDG